MDSKFKSITSMLLDSNINTPLNKDFLFKTERRLRCVINTWFSFLKHDYHYATKQLIIDAFINGKSFRADVGKPIFFKEIYNAVNMFRLDLLVRKGGNIVSVPKQGKRLVFGCPCCANSRIWNECVNIEISVPDNHVLKTIHFPGHTLIDPCNTYVSERKLMNLEEIRTKKIIKMEFNDMQRLYTKVIDIGPLNGLKIKKTKGISNKLNLINKSAYIIQSLFMNNKAKKISNKLRMEPDNLFHIEFSEMRKRILKIDDSSFKKKETR